MSGRVSPEPPATSAPDYSRFAVPLFTQVQQDFKFWLMIVTLLCLFRWVMIGLFRGEMLDSTTWVDLATCVRRGLQFDICVATFWVLPCVLASLACGLGLTDRVAQRIRRCVVWLFLVLTPLLLAMTIAFYSEFKDQFNHWILRGMFDDFRAIVSTIWKEYHPLCFLAGAGAVSGGLWLAVRRWIQRPFWTLENRPGCCRSAWRNVTAVAFLVGALILGLRGSAGRRPIQMKDASPTKDAFLNKMIVNPYWRLRLVAWNYRAASGGVGFKTLWPDGDIRSAVQTAFPGVPIHTNLDQMIIRRAPGNTGQKPRHIFVIVMESHDAWPMMDQYRSLRLAEGLRELAQGGIRIPAFLPASDGTVSSMSTFITGLPDAGIQLNLHAGARTPFPTAPAEIFKRLGYRTRMFRAGFLSWQDYGDYCVRQGFEEVHGGGHMFQGGDPREWGVDDDRLFSYVQQHTPDDAPSFNILLSRTFHPPYGLDVFGMGYPVREIPPDLKALYDRKTSLSIFGHLWFADRELRRFVLETERRLPNSVFAITGDHWSRRSIGSRPNLYERNAVTMVWRGSNVLAGVRPPPRMAGAHIDIVPTLVEMVAPAGFEYHAFGRNLFLPHPAPVGFGHNAVVTPDFVFEMANPSQVLSLLDMVLQQRPDLATPLALRNRAIQAVAWWRVVKGPFLPSGAPLPPPVAWRSQRVTGASESTH